MRCGSAAPEGCGLLGAAEALRDRHRPPLPAGTDEQRLAARAALRAVLGVEPLSAATATGRILTLDLLIAEAAGVGETHCEVALRAGAGHVPVGAEIASHRPLYTGFRPSARPWARFRSGWRRGDRRRSAR